MDLLLQKFVEIHFTSLSGEEQQAFLELLDETDMDIMDWIMERKEPPARAFKSLINKIRAINGPVYPDRN